MEKSHLGHSHDPISRPHSVLSIADSITTTTSIADFEDSLSAVTTPRGGSPTHFGNGNPDLPPSYDESQAALLSSPDEGLSGVQTVYRTEIHTDAEARHDDGQRFEERGVVEEPGSSALLYRALAFTDGPPPAAAAAYVAHLTRPVAIPSLPCPSPFTSSSSLPTETHGVRFARLHARALNSASITPAQHAAFIDGLNAVSTASGFSVAQLRTDAPFSFEQGSGIRREEWVRAYIQLCNARFFQPRGLHAGVITLAELVVLAKVPELRGFREGILDDVLASASLDVRDIGGGGFGEEERLTKVATEAAVKLEPFIEPLASMIPTMNRESMAIDNVARGLASFSLDEKPLPQLPLSNSSPQPRALDKFWNPLGFGPISLGPILPPSLPTRDPAYGPSVQGWAEDLGRRFDQWGVEYGRLWEKWGREYGQAWNEWGETLNQKMTGNPSSTSLRHLRTVGGGIGASRESFATSGSGGSKKGKARQPPVTGAEEWEDDDDASSTTSSNSSSSDDTIGEDPETAYAKRVADIEAAAMEARTAGKKSAARIDRDRESALRKAEDKRHKDSIRLERKLQKREVKRHAKQFKHNVKKWKKDFKRESKGWHKGSVSHEEMHARMNARKAQFHQMRAEWERRRAEMSRMQRERGVVWRQEMGSRRRGRGRGWGREQAECCPMERMRERRTLCGGEEQPDVVEEAETRGHLTQETMLWVVIRNLE